MKKKLTIALVLACATPTAAWAVPPGNHGPGGPPHTPPGLANRDDNNTNGNGNGSSSDSPAATCFKERRDMGVSDFNDKYGTNANKSNAFGKCVSEEAQKRADDNDKSDKEDDNDSDD